MGLHPLAFPLTSPRLSPVFTYYLCFLILLMSVFLWVRLIRLISFYQHSNESWFILQLTPHLLGMFGVSLYPIHMEKGLGHTYSRNICQNSKVTGNSKSCKFKILSVKSVNPNSSLAKKLQSILLDTQKKTKFCTCLWCTSPQITRHNP